jgi:glycosyltransferase involved in cell wall biosynthesis
MSIAVCVGGTKQQPAVRMSCALARRLQAAGKEVVLFALKGSIKQAGPVALKEFGATATAKTLAGHFTKNNVTKVISLMNLRACEAALAAKIPFVYAEYDGFKEDKPSKTKKATLKKAKKVIVLCDGNQPLTKRTYTGLPAVRVTVPALGVEHYSWGRPAAFKKANNIIAVGSLTKESGFEMLLACWEKLAPLHPSWHLTLVGDGTLRAALSRTITKKNLQASTELVSAAGGVEPFLAQADIFISAADGSVRPDELLAAMASKLPTLALDNTTTRRLIQNGFNGVLAADENAFANALDNLMVDWGYRVGLAVNAATLKEQRPLDAFVKTVWETL